MLNAALVQLNSSDDPAANLPRTEALIRDAAAGGAELILTPEVTNIVSASRAVQDARLALEQDDATLARLRAVAAERGVWLSLGSLALKSDDPDGRFVNRQFLIGPDGGIRARYDKIHMFDVQLSEDEVYRESAHVSPGAEAVIEDTPWGRIGHTICYDLRFPCLYRDLAKAGAEILTVPAAFTKRTGEAHWHVLIRARAIENGAFVVAAAACGAVPGGGETYGHSLIVDPWGAVLAEGGEAPGVALARIDLDAVAAVRAQIPSLSHDRDYRRPASLATAAE